MMLDDRCHHDVVGVEAQPVGQMIDRLGRVAAENGREAAVPMDATGLPAQAVEQGA